MSNIIPMVSSSPPPIDDGGGFGWDDDDDDFGTFASADDGFQTPAKKVNHDEPFMNSVPDDNMQDGDFADFEAFSDQKTQEAVPPITKDLNVDTRPDTIPIVEDQVNEIDDVSVKTDDGNFGSSDRTLIDSGVYSSNISPVQQCDDIDITGNVTAVSTSVHLSDNVTDTNHSCIEPEPCPAHSTIPNDNVEPQVVCLDDSESNEAEKCENTGTSIPEQDSSLPQSHIPSEDIPSNPESDVMNSHHNSTDNLAEVILSNPESDVMNSDDNMAEVVPSDLNARTNKESENESESLETKSGNESENNDCVEPNVCQNQLHSDLNFDSDLKTQNTEQLTHSANGDSDFVGPGNESAEDTCEITSSALNERLNGNNNTELNIDTENDNRTGINSDSVNSECSVSEPSGYDGSAVDSEITTKDVLKTVDEDGPTNTDKPKVEVDSHETNNLTEKSEVPEALELQSDDIEEEMGVNKSGDINNSLQTSNNEQAETDDWDEFSEFSSQVDTKTASNDISDENKGFGEFNNAGTCDNNTGNSNSGNKDDDDIDDDDDDDEFSDFSQNIKNDSIHVDDKVDTEEPDDFGDFNASFEQNASSVNNDDFGDFNATFETETEKIEEQSNDWAAFSEPQIVNDTGTLSDDGDDEWSGFADDSTDTVSQPKTTTATVKEDTDSIPPSQLAHMSNHEKVVFAVTACFPALIMDMDINSSHDPTSLSAFSLVSGESGIWSHVESQRKTNALTYQWTKSQWNTQLFTTLHIDTQNILIGHKKTVVPVFASGLTLLEPTKGSTSLKPDVLVDTSKSDSIVTSQSQISAVMRPNKNARLNTSSRV